jgi:hypothetical protein
MRKEVGSAASLESVSRVGRSLDNLHVLDTLHVLGHEQHVSVSYLRQGGHTAVLADPMSLVCPLVNPVQATAGRAVQHNSAVRA